MNDKVHDSSWNCAVQQFEMFKCNPWARVAELPKLWNLLTAKLLSYLASHSATSSVSLSAKNCV